MAKNAIYVQKNLTMKHLSIFAVTVNFKQIQWLEKLTIFYR